MRQDLENDCYIRSLSHPFFIVFLVACRSDLPRRLLICSGALLDVLPLHIQLIQLRSIVISGIR